MKVDNTEEALKKAPIRHNEAGEEILDDTVMQPPLGYKRAPSLSEQIAQQIRQHKLAELLADDAITETDEEADDFDVVDDDGVIPFSKHENEGMPSIKELKKRAQELNEQIRQAQRKKAIEDHENALRKPAGVTSPPLQPENNDLTLKDTNGNPK